MMDETGPVPPPATGGRTPPDRTDADEADDDGSIRSGPDRLPPPAFAPGVRRAPLPRRPEREDEDDDPWLPSGALIPPDAPIRAAPETSVSAEASAPPGEDELGQDMPASAVEDAASTSAEPPVEGASVPPSPASFEEGDAWPDEAPDPGSMPDEATEVPGEPILDLPSGRDGWSVAALLEELADEIRREGSIRIFPESYVSPFEAALRGLIAGYTLTGPDDGRGDERG